MSRFIAEVSSNHNRDLDRSREFVRAAAAAGCWAVKFQLFRIDELFAPEILAVSAGHRRRREWELPLSFLAPLRAECDRHGIQFGCTPFYLAAVAELAPHVHFYKVASYELLWHDLIAACARTGKPLILSTGMATLPEIDAAVECAWRAFPAGTGPDLTVLHCVSGYPTPLPDCNLAAIGTLRARYAARYPGIRFGWSDHSVHPGVVSRAVDHWGADVVEFHLDLDGAGAEAQVGHCWQPNGIAAVIRATNGRSLAAHEVALVDGSGEKVPTAAELSDVPWRADPSDGLRPFKSLRGTWRPKA
ncbi:MAG TPA: N-acetylneuraminate synthase family protein [Lacunisphaera sp.]|nr:N-acetylneuraminate synthase family protein [Lacunisphaera sp.]